MKFNWLSLESSLIVAYIFECIFWSLKGNIRYILHQIQQNIYEETEYQIASSESLSCYIFNCFYTLHLLRRKLICPSQTERSIFLLCIMCQYLNFRPSSSLYNTHQKGHFNIIKHEIQLQNCNKNDKCL